MSRGLDLLFTVMSNSGAIVSVSEYFHFCHSQPIGRANQLGLAKEQSRPCLIPGSQQKKERPGASLCHQTASPPP